MYSHPQPGSLARPRGSPQGGYCAAPIPEAADTDAITGSTPDATNGKGPPVSLCSFNLAMVLSQTILECLLYQARYCAHAGLALPLLGRPFLHLLFLSRFLSCLSTGVQRHGGYTGFEPGHQPQPP